jgi:hypothetical protein
VLNGYDRIKKKGAKKNEKMDKQGILKKFSLKCSPNFCIFINFY